MDVTFRTKRQLVAHPDLRRYRVLVDVGAVGHVVHAVVVASADAPVAASQRLPEVVDPAPKADAWLVWRRRSFEIVLEFAVLSSEGRVVLFSEGVCLDLVEVMKVFVGICHET